MTADRVKVPVSRICSHRECNISTNTGRVVSLHIKEEDEDDSLDSTVEDHHATASDDEFEEKVFRPKFKDRPVIPSDNMKEMNNDEGNPLSEALKDADAR